MPTTNCETDCAPTCPQVFSDLLVYPQIIGGTKVAWSMHPKFTDPAPYAFQLQYSSRGPENDDDAWTDVGALVDDTFVLTDVTQRNYGKYPLAHYRVKLLTSVGTYFSKPARIDGYLPFRERRLMRAIVREEILRFRKTPAGSVGYLLKRRHSGECCSCLDELTREVGNPDCLICYGTGFVGGYYQPAECTYVEFLIGDTERSRVHEMRGTAEEGLEQGRMLNIPQVFSRDVWVSKDTDMRYSIESFKTAVELRGSPIVLQPVELRRLPFTHVIYNFLIANQQRI